MSATDQEYKRALDEIDELRELLRQHVMDWGECDHPEDCVCSDAAARRLLRPVDR